MRVDKWEKCQNIEASTNDIKYDQVTVSDGEWKDRDEQRIYWNTHNMHIHTHTHIAVWTMKQFDVTIKISKQLEINIDALTRFSSPINQYRLHNDGAFLPMVIAQYGITFHSLEHCNNCSNMALYIYKFHNGLLSKQVLKSRARCNKSLSVLRTKIQWFCKEHVYKSIDEIEMSAGMRECVCVYIFLLSHSGRQIHKRISLLSIRYDARSTHILPKQKKK